MHDIKMKNNPKNDVIKNKINTSRLIVLKQLEVFPPHHFFMFSLSIINKTFSLRYFLKKKVKTLKYVFFFYLTLTFDLYFILTGKGQHYNLKWFNGLTM